LAHVTKAIAKRVTVVWCDVGKLTRRPLFYRVGIGSTSRVPWCGPLDRFLTNWHNARCAQRAQQVRSGYGVLAYT